MATHRVTMHLAPCWQVATFFGPQLQRDARVKTDGGAAMSSRCLMPPEIFSAKPDADAARPPSCPAKAVPGGRGGGDSTMPTADVWGMGTFVFELATGRSAGGMYWGVCFVVRGTSTSTFTE